MEEKFSAAWGEMISRLNNWFETLIVNLPNIVIAILVFVLFYFIARKIHLVIKKPLGRYFKQDSVKLLVARFAAIGVIALGFILVLGILNLDTALKSMLAGAGVAGLAVGLALQGTLSNTISGIYLAVKEVINVGDWVESNGYGGTVHKITLRNTILKEPDNNLVVIPNNMVIENPFKNYGLTTRIRVVLECGVGYESDLESVKKIATNAVKERFHENYDDDVEFYYTEFGSSSINFLMRFWVDAIEKQSILEARSESIILIKKTFDEHGINIPFPIRTLDIKDGTKDYITKVTEMQVGNNN